MSGQQMKLTREKFEELSRELETLKTARRKEVAENLEYAKSLGDLSENAEYHEARNAQAQLEDRIGKLEYALKTAAIVSEKEKKGGAVGVGALVRLRREKDGAELLYKIVGTEEGNIADGKLSVDSPLAQALIGKQEGGTCAIETPSGVNKYTLLSVE